MEAVSKARVLLINAPSRRGQAGYMLPMGLLYVGGIAERSGHKAAIFDPYLDDVDLERYTKGDFGNIYSMIEEFKPDVIGYGGIATSYGYTKKLSLSVKEKYPGIFQIAGGALSSVDDLLIEKTGIDMVFHGESEASLPVFLENIGKGDAVYDTPGVSYKRGGVVCKNRQAEQIADLDLIPFPAYNLLDIKKYLCKTEEWAEGYRVSLEEDGILPAITERIRNKAYYIPIVASRGCTHACLFCYRHVKGIRRHSVRYVISHMRHLKDRYGISGFQFCDELFNNDPQWVLDFCDAVEKEIPDIFYIIGGARVDKVDGAMLKRLSETGCIEVGYGQESGSDVILREYRKGVTASRNKEITNATKRQGMNCPVQLVIGSPAETDDTINDTIGFLKDVKAYSSSLNYLIPLPRTPVWKIVEERRAVNDLEEYLDIVALRGAAMINLTTVPDRVFRNWGPHINNEMQLEYCRKHCAKTVYFKKLFILKGAEYLRLILPHRAVRAVKALIKSIKSLWK